MPGQEAKSRCSQSNQLKDALAAGIQIRRNGKRLSYRIWCFNGSEVRLLDEADKTEIHVCEKCGLIAYFDAKQRKYICRVDGDAARISTVVIAYAFKLLLQEMMSLNIAPRLLLKDKV